MPCWWVRSWSSRYFSTVPSVATTVRSSSSVTPSAASAWAQSMVSATPGGLYRFSVRSVSTAPATCRASRSSACGTRMRTMRTSRSKSGCSTQWYRQRRFSASCTSRVRLEVRMTIGGFTAANRPSSGTVTAYSESTSSR